MRKKKLKLITLDELTKENYLNELLYFFGEYLDVEGYSIKTGIKGVIEGDLAIITSPVLTNIVKKYLSNNIETIYMNRTFTRDNVKSLYDLPSGLKVMMVTNTNSSAISCIASLFEIGIKQLDLTPVYPEMDVIPDAKIAITPAQLDYIPSNVEKIINIGWRVIDISTLMDISTKLGIMDKKLEEKIGRYAQDIIPISHGLHFSINNTSILKNEMNIVLNVIDDGVIIMDKNDRIIYCNESTAKILNYDEKYLYGLIDIHKVLPHEVMTKVTEHENLENVLIKSQKLNKSLIVTKRIIKIYDEIYGYAIIMKDITEFENLENQLRKQLVQQGYIAKYEFKDIIGKSPQILKVIEKAKKIADIGATTLIVGETGTGKELFAQSIHNASKRRFNPFVAINCAALPSELLESELFGYEEGAFTGAKKGGKKGLFELAHRGTIFLDEIGDIPMDVQVKLLRVLQEKEVMRIGGNSIITIDVNVIAATNHDLKSLIHHEKFRKDLYYRLNVLNLHVPPLRERTKDIPYLIKDILQKINMEHKIVDHGLLKILINYMWEGNVRELKNCIECMAYMGGDVLTIEDLPIDIEYKEDDLYITKSKGILPDLFPEENEIVLFIMDLLRNRNCGRRVIYSQACMRGFETTEFRIRKLMNLLYNEGLIIYETKRKGATLTDKGRKLIDSI